jgi:hypothetical protein
VVGVGVALKKIDEFKDFLGRAHGEASARRMGKP